jgi:hypothetical protein
MNLKLTLTSVYLLLFLLSSVYSQGKTGNEAGVKNVDFNLTNEELVISYDLTNYKSHDLFRISVSISTESGAPVSAKSFSGDVGDNIKGGTGKQIIWDISKDVTLLDDKIVVEVVAVNQNPVTEITFSKGKALVLSTLYPGLGSSKMTGKKFHLLEGALAYSALAGSFIFKNKADGFADKYSEASISLERDQYFSSYQKYNSISKTLIYTTAAIWIFDYMTVLLTDNRSPKQANKNKVSLVPAYGPDTNFAGMTMIYNF